MFAVGHAVSNDGVEGWGILIGGFGFALASAAMLRRALRQWN
jgi:hypothetical protein